MGSIISDSYGNAGVIVAGIEAAKQDLRKEFDEDLKTVAAGLYGTTDSSGRLVTPGVVHMLQALDVTLKFICNRMGIVPEDITNWHAEQVEKAKVDGK